MLFYENRVLNPTLTQKTAFNNNIFAVISAWHGRLQIIFVTKDVGQLKINLLS
jgi:hypothetical protein